MKRIVCLVIALAPLTLFGQSVRDTSAVQPKGSAQKVYVGQVTLPAGGRWTTVVSPQASSQLYIFLADSATAERPPQEEDETDVPVPQKKQPPPQPLTWTLVAVRPAGATGAIELSLTDITSGSTQKVKWDVSTAAAGDEKSVTETLRKARLGKWNPYLITGDAPVLRSWAAAYNEEETRPNREEREERSPSVFGLLGGRAAVQETLQLQVLSGGEERNPPKEGIDRTVPIAEIKGVEVKSHPYANMLKDAKGGQLDLANVVPADRFFVYVAKPAALMPMLDDGADFISKAGSAATGNGVEYDLKQRYLRRMGMDEKWLRSLLASGAVKEMALVFSDLFFIDGADVTAVSQVTEPKLLEVTLKLLSVNLSGDKIVARDVGNGQTAYWALRKNLFFVSTSKSELDAVLALQAGGGKETMGQSAEFRYMLTKLAPDSQTRIFAYFSDPFIRRLVGPAMKIGQLRRLAARAEMERIAAASLLARLDGMEKLDSPQALMEAGYMPKRQMNDEYTIGKDLLVASKTWGPLPSMKTLAEAPVDKATPVEAEAYEAYLDNYNRFWRMFFDPIAIRLNDAADGSLEMSTFILPLIDNSAYNSIRQVVATREKGPDLKIPTVSPDPVVMLSLNFTATARHEASRGLSEVFMEYARINPAILNELGPGLHFAVYDSDPIIGFGGGDFLGAFGAGNALMGGRGGEMMFVPMLLSILTRPCSLIVETQDPEATKHFLAAATRPSPDDPRWRGRRDEFGIEFYEVGGGDSWLLSVNIMGVIRLRFGIEVQDRYVIVRNIPWTSRDKISGAETAALNGARLAVKPAACNLLLPSLHTAAADQARKATFQAMGFVYPLLISGCATPEEAAAKHAAIFGYRPVLPDDGKLVWQSGELSSPLYGSPYRQKQPGYSKDKPDFGLTKGVSDVSVNMQFEESGLRTLIRWKAEKKPAGK